MSHQPPYGPSPPYGYQPAPAVLFLPAPVMLPMYPPQPVPAPPASTPSQPTYVTNYYYPPEQAQPPPPQPTTIQDDIEWVRVTRGTAAQYAQRAVVAGHDCDGSPLWVIRAHHNGELVPGKLAAKRSAAYIPYQGKEVPVHNFDVLLAKPHLVKWVHTSNGHAPINAIAAGNTHTGEPLYIARVRHQWSITPGKVHRSHQCAYISFNGDELSFKQHEVFCKVLIQICEQ